MSKTHWKSLTNPDYIGAYSIPPGEDLVVTIDSISSEIVTSRDGRKDECIVARLKQQKPLVLNVTNCTTLSNLYGPYIQNWIGKRAALYASTAKYSGEVVECVRIRPQVPKAPHEPQPISDERLKRAIASINAGEYTVDKLRATFLLSDAQSELVDARLNSNESSGE